MGCKPTNENVFLRFQGRRKRKATGREPNSRENKPKGSGGAGVGVPPEIGKGKGLPQCEKGGMSVQFF